MNRSQVPSCSRSALARACAAVLLVHFAACAEPSVGEGGGGVGAEARDSRFSDARLPDTTTDPAGEGGSTITESGAPSPEPPDASADAPMGTDGAAADARNAPDRAPIEAASADATPADAAPDARPRDAATDRAVESGSRVDGGLASADASLEDDLQFCVDENNRYRATLAVAPLGRSSALERFARMGAQVDYQAGVAHEHFTTSNGVPGAQLSAENEIPGFSGWSLARQKTVHDVIVGGLALMWAEGPGGGHYENMRNAALHNVGCGIYIAPNAMQDVTVTIDFTN